MVDEWTPVGVGNLVLAPARGPPEPRERPRDVVTLRYANMRRWAGVFAAALKRAPPTRALRARFPTPTGLRRCAAVARESERERERRLLRAIQLGQQCCFCSRTHLRGEGPIRWLLALKVRPLDVTSFAPEAAQDQVRDVMYGAGTTSFGFAFRLTAFLLIPRLRERRWAGRRGLVRGGRGFLSAGVVLGAR